MKAPKAVQITATAPSPAFPAGARLVGIDVRPLTGELYGVGSDSIMYKLPDTGDPTALALPPGPLRAAEPQWLLLRGRLQPGP